MKIFIHSLVLIFVLTLTGEAQNLQLNKAVEETLLSSEITVKDAPFSADAIGENVQILADGNKIKNTFNSKMYRDSEGRFRREGTINPGLMLMQFLNIKPVFQIADPIAGVKYYLDIATKTAREVKMKPIYFSNDNKPIEVPASPKGQQSNAIVIESDYGKHEDLGTKQIEGVEVVGNRAIHGINAGSIGNEKPIEIIYERWYSMELKQVIFSRYYDPRYGEQTYRLTNISRNNPSRSLFELPAGYKIARQKGIIEIPVRPERPPRPPIEKRP